MLIISGDLNSLMRFMNICQLSTDNDLKIHAMQALLLSIEHEEEVSRLPSSSSSTNNPFPAFITWINRMGGVAAMWHAVLDVTRLSSTQHPNNRNNNNFPNHPELRNLSCQFIEKLHDFLPYKKEELTASFIAAGGIPLLGECLDIDLSAESAAKAMSAVVASDVTGIAFGNAHESDDGLVLHILNLVSSHPSSVKECLSIVLTNVVKREVSYLPALINARILPVYASVLKEDSSAPLKEVSMSLIAAVLRIVKKDPSFQTILDKVMQSLVDADLLSGLLEIIPSDDLALTKLSLAIIEMLSATKLCHIAMISETNHSTPVVTKVNEVLHQVSALSSDSSEEQASFDIIISSCVKVLRDLSMTLLDKEAFLKSVNFLDPVLLVACSQNRLTSAETHMDCVNLLCIFSVYPLFSERLEAMDGHYILCDQISINYNSFINTAKEVSPLILITYILYHASALQVIPTELRLLNSRQRELQMWNEESLYQSIAGADALWVSVRNFLQGTHLITSALRFLQVITGCHFERAQCLILEQIKKNEIIPYLMQLVDAEKKLPRPVVENAMIVLGTLSGCSPFYPWEASLLNQRLAVIKQAGNHVPTLRGGGLDHREACVLLAAQKRSETKMDSRKRNNSSSSDENQQMLLKLRKDLTSLESLKRLCAPAFARSGGRDTAFIGASRIIQMCTDYSVDNNIANLVGDESFKPLCTHEIFNFTSAIPGMDPISRISAIQTFSILARHLDIPTKNPPKALFNTAIAKSIQYICDEMSSEDPVVVVNSLFAIEVLVKRWGQAICSSGGAHFIKLLDFEKHLNDENIDSVFVVGRTLSIVEKLSHREQVVNQLAPSEIVEKLVKLLVVGNEISGKQTMKETVSRSIKSGESVQVAGVALKCINNLSRFTSSRKYLLKEEVLDPLLQCVVDSPSAMRIANDKEFASGPPHMVKPLPNDEADRATEYSRISLQKHTKTLLDTIYQLASCPGSTLFTAFHRNAEILTHFFLLVWRDYHATPLGFKIVAMLLRCGCGFHLSLPQSIPQVEVLHDENTLTSPPWEFLCKSEQLYLLFEMINFDINPQDPNSPVSWEMDQDCVVRAKRHAMAAFHSLLVPGGFNFDAHHLIVLDLCSSSNFLRVLENYAPRAAEATVCMADVFSWSDVNFRYTSKTFVNTTIQILQQGSGSNMSRCAAVRVLGSAVLHSPTSRATILAQLPRAAISQDLNQVITLCLQFLTLATSEGGIPEESEKGPLKWPDTLVLGLVLVTALFDRGRTGPESQYSNAELHVQATACQCLVSMLRGYVNKRQACWDNTEELNEIPSSMWRSLLSCSSSRTCATYLLQNCDVMSLLEVSLGLHAQEYSRNVDYEPSEDMNMTIQILVNLIDIYPVLTVGQVVHTSKVHLHLSTILLQIFEKSDSSPKGTNDTFVKPALLSLFYNLSCNHKHDTWTVISECPKLLDFLVHHVIHDLGKHNELESTTHAGDIVLTPEQVRERDMSVLSTTETVATLVNLSRHFKSRNDILATSGFLVVVVSFLSTVPITDRTSSEHLNPLVSACLSLIYSLIPSMYSGNVSFTGGDVSTLGAVVNGENTSAVSSADGNAGDIVDRKFSMANMVVQSLLRIATDILDLKCIDLALCALLLIDTHVDFFECFRTTPVVLSLFRIFSRVVPYEIARDEENYQSANPYTLLQTEVCDKSLQLIYSAARGDPTVFNAALVTPLLHCRESDRKKHNNKRDVPSREVKTESASLVASVVHVLTTAPRSMLWYPVILRTSDILKTLILNETCTDEIIHRMRQVESKKPTGNLDSHVLMNSLNISNDIMQPRRVPSLQIQSHILSNHHIAQSQWVDTMPKDQSMETYPSQKELRAQGMEIITNDEDDALDSVFHIGSSSGASFENSPDNSTGQRFATQGSLAFDHFDNQDDNDSIIDGSNENERSDFDSYSVPLGYNQQQLFDTSNEEIESSCPPYEFVARDEDESMTLPTSEPTPTTLPTYEAVSLPTTTNSLPSTSGRENLSPSRNPLAPGHETTITAAKTLHEQRVAEMRAKAQELKRLKQLEKEGLSTGSTVISVGDSAKREDMPPLYSPESIRESHNQEQDNDDNDSCSSGSMYSDVEIVVQND